MTDQDVRDLMLEFSELCDQYIEQDRWDIVYELEQRMLVAFGNVDAMRTVISDYFWEMNA